MVNLAGAHLMNQENRREKGSLKGRVRTPVGCGIEDWKDRLNDLWLSAESHLSLDKDRGPGEC